MYRARAQKSKRQRMDFLENEIYRAARATAARLTILALIYIAIEYRTNGVTRILAM